MMWSEGGFLGMGGWFQWLTVGLVLLLVLRLLLTHGRERAAEKNALEILKTRYAKGEISEAEYLKMKDQIG